MTSLIIGEMGFQFFHDQNDLKNCMKIDQRQRKKAPIHNDIICEQTPQQLSKCSAIDAS